MQDLMNVALILLWPIFCCFLFTRMETVSATFFAIVGGMMIMPVRVEFDLPLIPAIDKNVSASLGALMGILLIKKAPFQWFGTKSTRYLISAILCVPIINLAFNTEPHFTGEVWKPGLTLYEAASAILLTYLTLLPLIIGMNVVKNEQDVIRVFKYLVLAALIYLPLVIFELRFSPQLHNIVYGFHPHSFIQQIRNGGFRSVVFLGHGLLTANFYLGVFISLAILFKLKKFFISKGVHVGLILLFVLCLILLKSITALVLAIAGMFFISLNGSARRTAFLSIIFVISTYPFIVYFGVIPLDWLYENLQSIFPIERLDSLYFRFYNEKVAIDYLGYKIAVGFGGLGRAVIDGVITDGSWLVWTLRFGVLFWVLCVVLYSRPVFLKFLNAEFKNRVILYSVLPIVILLDQIPNSSWSMPWIWLLSGAIIGFSESEQKRYKSI